MPHPVLGLFWLVSVIMEDRLRPVHKLALRRSGGVWAQDNLYARSQNEPISVEFDYTMEDITKRQVTRSQHVYKSNLMNVY